MLRTGQCPGGAGSTSILLQPPCTAATPTHGANPELPSPLYSGLSLSGGCLDYAPSAGLNQIIQLWQWL